MIARFFQQLLNSCGLVFRTFRAFLTRQVVGLRARIRRVTSLSRQAVRLVPKAMSTVAVAGKKPTKREDFVETKRLFVAKSLLIMLVLGLIAFGLLFYFVIWPWLVRMFFTARLYQNDEAVATYSGKVVVCYDEEKDMPMLQGKMEDGMIQGQESRPGATQIDALVPLANMFGYATDLRSSTQGRGQYSMEPHSYVEIPKSIAEKIIAERGRSNAD